MYERSIVWIEQNKLDKAVSSLHQIVEQARTIANRELELDALLELGLIYSRYLRDFDRAEACYEEGRVVAHQTGHREFEMTCLFGLANSDFERGISAGSRRLLGLASDLFLQCITGLEDSEAVELLAQSYLRYARCRLMLGDRYTAKEAKRKVHQLLRRRELPQIRPELRGLRKLLGIATLLGPVLRQNLIRLQFQ